MKVEWFLAGMRVSICALAALIFGLSGYAGSLPDHFVKFDGKDDALSGDQIMNVHRGRFGFLWLGTQRGLIRFDGESIRWYRHDPEDALSLSSSDIQVLFEDGANRFWIGTSDGLNLLNRKTGLVNRIQLGGESGDVMTKRHIWSLADDGAGGLWIGTETGLFHWQGAKTHITALGEVKRVSALQRTKSGHLFVGSDGQGLFWQAAGSSELQFVEAVPVMKVLDLLVADDGRLWIASTDGLFTLNSERPTSCERVSLPFSREDQAKTPWVTALAQDGKGRIWIGTRAGLFAWGDDNIRSFFHDASQTDSLSDNRVVSLFSDDEGILWVSTLVRSLDQLNLNREKVNYRGFASHGVQSILVSERDTRIWVATKGGLANLDPNSGEPVWALRKEIIRQVMAIDDDTYLLATDRGLLAFDPRTEKVSEIWLEKRVWRLFRERGGQVFLGTDSGLYQYNPQTGIQPLLGSEKGATAKLTHPVVTAIESAGEGALWIGTFGGGLHHYSLDTGQVRQYDKGAESLTANDVVDLFIDDRERLWIATLNGGLNIWDGQTMIPLSRKQGFPDNAVVCVLQDRHGQMWANTGAGIVRFNADGSDPVVFSQRDGNLCGAAIPGAGLYDSSSDTVYFGGSEGLVWFQAASMEIPKKPRLVFTSFKARGGERRHLILPNENLPLKQEDAPFSLDYAVLDFLSNRQYNYGYRREAVDTEWVFTQNKIPVNFTGNLTFGGRDRLWVRAHSDVTGPLEAQINLAIATPAWLRWVPAIGALVILVLGTILYYWISARERRKRLKLEEQARLAEARRGIAEEKARLAELRESNEREMRHRQETHNLVLQEHLDQVSTEIAHELHDGPLSMLQGLRFNLRDIEVPVPASQSVLSELTDQWIPEINRKLRHLCGQLLKPQLTQGLVIELENITQSLQWMHPEWRLTSAFDHRVEAVKETVQVNLVRIYRTLLNNVSKHAKARRVNCELRLDGALVTLCIADDGCGFEVPDNMDWFRDRKHYGLYMAAHFAANMEGQLKIDSQAEKGTTITVCFPSGGTVELAS